MIRKIRPHFSFKIISIERCFVVESLFKANHKLLSFTHSQMFTYYILTDYYMYTYNWTKRGVVICVYHVITLYAKIIVGTELYGFSLLRNWNMSYKCRQVHDKSKSLFALTIILLLFLLDNTHYVFKDRVHAFWFSIYKNTYT